MYSAFSQLVADNQFSALGVVLLGIVADVAAAAAALLPATPLPGPEPQPESEKVDVVGRKGNVDGAEGRQTSIGTRGAGRDDEWELGVPVSRDELEQQQQRPRGSDQKRRTRASAAPITESLSTSGQRKKKR